MKKIQLPAVAGVFYPDDPEELHHQVQTFLSAANSGVVETPKALIAPHAGYIYSGPVAASAYAQLDTISDRIRRVVILAPSHHVGFRGIATSTADLFQTPLGILEVDRTALDKLHRLPLVHPLDDAFEQEHSLEVHLPFLQEVLGDFRIVPLVVGDTDPGDVEEALEMLWGGDETLIVISSDLSHYNDYETARQMDRETSNAIEKLQADNISFQQACGRIPVSGLLLAARHHHLQATTVDLRNSGDTAGSKDRVVGYGAYVLS
jgi:AmmeMemoRadiSam system protein B